MRGRKSKPRVKTAPEEQVIVPVPPIIEDTQFDAVQEKLVRNKKLATRNLKYPYKGLLRASLAKCAQSGGNLIIQIREGRYKGKEGIDASEIRYQCCNYAGTVSKCKGCSIDARMLDAAGWEQAVEIIRDPSELNKRVKELTADNPTIEQHKKTLTELNNIRKRQTSLRNNLNTLMQEKKLDKGTREFFNGQLALLAQQEEDALKELADEEALQQKYKLLQERIVAFHKRCTDWREKLDDPQFTPSYDFKREACEFFGITAIVWKSDHEPRYEIQSNPPDIVSLISSDM